MTAFITNNSAKAALDAIVDRVDLGSGTASGHLKIYSGSVPTDADTALGAQVLLADLAMSNPAFGAAADNAPGAIATASAITQDSSADAGGTASFFRIVDRDGNAVMQGACATSGSQLNLVTTTIVATQPVQVTSLTVTLPES